MENIVNKAREFAIKAHSDVNHSYDGKSYDIHLKMVSEFASQFQYLIEDEFLETVHAACWLHDTIEDCRLTFNDIKKEFGADIAEITYALTNEKGKTRKDRANAKYYEGIRSVPYADFVKICDRLANVSYSKNKNSRMIDAYRKENNDFKKELYQEKYESMFNLLEELLK